MTGEELFQSLNRNHEGFANIKEKRSRFCDIHAILLLEELNPSLDKNKRKAIPTSDHDEYWLAFDAEEVFENATPDQLQELVDCGVMYDEGYVSFMMFA